MVASSDLSHRFEAESVGRALELVGERWTLLILREAFFGVRRFGQLARTSTSRGPRCRPGCGCWSTRPSRAGPLFPGPERHEYRLTDAGRDLFGAIVTLMRWGDQYLPHPSGPPVVLRHHSCGEIADPRLTCAHCGEEITAHNVTPEAGPGFRADLVGKELA